MSPLNNACGRTSFSCTRPRQRRRKIHVVDAAEPARSAAARACPYPDARRHCRRCRGTRRAIRKSDACKNTQARSVRARRRKKSTRLDSIEPCARGSEQRIRLITTSDDLKRRARARARGCASRRALDTGARGRAVARSAHAFGSNAERSASSRGRLVARGALRERRARPGRMVDACAPPTRFWRVVPAYHSARKNAGARAHTRACPTRRATCRRALSVRNASRARRVRLRFRSSSRGHQRAAGNGSFRGDARRAHVPPLVADSSTTKAEG